MKRSRSFEDRTISKVAMRFMPFLTIAYFFASLDRVNVGFAAFQMNREVGLSPSAFGLGAGLFFIAYCLFAVPCNLMMEKIGARRWLSTVMIAWGSVAVCMSLVTGPTSFYLLRFLLGVAEAGFFPGVIFYFTLWFPGKYRSQMVAILMMALPVSSVLGSPVSAALLLTDGLLGIGGWRWLFIIEGAPAILMGLCCALVLPRTIKSAKFLSTNEQNWLTNQLASEDKKCGSGKEIPFWSVMFNRKLLALTLVYIGGTSVTNGLALWQPQILSGVGLTTMQVGLLNAVPFALGSVGMYLWGRHSDRTGERIMHTALPLAIGAIGLTAAMFVHSLGAMIAVLCVTVTAASMIKGPFWALATEMSSKSSAAVVIGQISSLNNIGVFGGTYLIGAIKEATGSFRFALTPFLVISVLACVTSLWLGRAARRESQESAFLISNVSVKGTTL